MNIKIKLLSIYIFLLSINNLAQTFTPSVSQTKVGLEDRFEVSFTFSHDEVNSAKNFAPPDLSSFLVLGGPNQSTSMQFINGVTSASRTYSFYLKGKSVGNYTIGSASIEYKGSIYKTEPLSIEIVKGSSQPQKQDEPNVDAEIAENLFVRAFADKQKVFQGEQVTVTYKLYTRLNIASQMSVSKLPQYQGFWAEELETSKNILFNTEVYEGKQYRVGILKKVALFPTQTGDLSVTPFELTVPVVVQKRRRSGNIFDEFFTDPFGRGETIEYNSKSNTIKINVLPLPSEDKPELFTGSVGDFTLNTSLDKNETKTNEPVSLKIDISGTGNIKLLDIPEIKLPPGVEKYEPKISEQINRSGRVSGKKSIEYLIVPRTPGIKEIPSIKFSFFNPSKKSYVTLSSNPFTLNVAQGERVFDTDISGLNKEDIKLLSEDIRYIKTSAGDLSKKSDLLIFSAGFWAAVGFPLVLLAGLVALRRRDEKLSANLQLLKYQKAQKVAKHRLKAAYSLMQLNQDTEFYAEVSLALFGYLEDKLNIPKAEFSIERAVFELQKRNVDHSLTERLQELAQKCEYVRFAPMSNGSAAMNDMYNNLSDLIIDIEKSLASKR
jgi:hypothetical protein